MKHAGKHRPSSAAQDPILTKSHRSKTFSTENAYRSHIISKRHKENELRQAERLASTSAPDEMSVDEVPSAPEAFSSTIVPEPQSAAPALSNETIEEDEDMASDASQTLDERLAAARSRIGPSACLFCSTSSSSVSDNLSHMSRTHGVFLPDAQYVDDLPGLITYLAEKLAIGNACLYCNREYRSLHAVRKHMVDKSHMKIAYESERQRLEISDFYDFSTSYPDGDAAGAARRQRTNGRKTITAASALADEEWDDEEEDGVTPGDDESVYDVESDEDDEGALSDEDLPNANIALGDTPYELVLPSGARVGHRSMTRYYKQNFSAPLPSKHSPTMLNSSGELVPTRKAIMAGILDDATGVLVPASGGGFGAFGKGTMTIKARNRGEAKEAGRHVREHRDQRRREQFKTQMGYRNNAQKHFRDPLLQ